MNTIALPILVAGFTSQASVIVAVGAQNTFVIRQGIARSHVAQIVGICVVADVMLISLGTQGMSQIVSSHPMAMKALTWLGAAVLLAYGIMAFARVYRALMGLRRPAALAVAANGATTQASALSSNSDNGGALPRTVAPSTAKGQISLRTAIITCLGFTFLNPGVYLDSIVLMGGLASSYGEQLKWFFAIGAMLCSATWFAMLGFLSAKMSKLFHSAHAWIVLDSVIGVTMLLLSTHMLMR